MEERKVSTVNLMDCTARDGGFAIGWDQPPSYVRDLIMMAFQCQIPYVEVGLANRPSEKSGWLDCINAGVMELIREPNVTDVKLVVMVDYSKRPNHDELIKLLKDGLVSLLRITCMMDNLQEVLQYAGKVREDAGVRVCVNIMQMHTLAKGDFSYIRKWVMENKPDVLYLADTFGCMKPDIVKNQFNELNSLRGLEIGLGFHGHNNLQLAFANSMMAVEYGANFIDCTVSGIGRGSGNLFTELAVSEWSPQGKDAVSLVSRFYDQWLAPMREQGALWGLNHAGIATALNHCHPSYSDLSDQCRSYAEFDTRLRNLNEEQRRVFHPYLFKMKGFQDGL